MTASATPTNITHKFIVHIMNKEQQGLATIIPCPSEKPVQQASKDLSNALTERYSGRAGKGYGKFEDDRDSYPMGNIVDDYFVNKTHSFYDTSIRMINHLKARADDESMSTGGYVIIAHNEVNGNHYLMVAILTSAVGSSVHDFEIQESEYLDIAKLRVAGRIDLTGRQNGKERYISFLKGQNSVAGYFKKFLGCNDILIAKQETTKLRNALLEFATERGFEPEAREEFLNKAHEKLKNLNRSGEAFDTQVFANEIWPTAPELLVEKLTNDDLEFSDGFVPDGNVIRGLVSFKGKSKHWSLKFERAALHDGSVLYDSENDKLILTEIPDTLRSEILSELGEEDEQ
ncbi:TPA: nucleoid-associated protein [Escherichia coli]|uniref:Nucleoid-associated protein n=4 Tax=Pseudomonadati TaxID=3379134 RepID=A0A921FAX0_9BACT|nr:nucleoid-associated protein [Escherichia coli]EKM4388341.1 nucleoid-associated protein [Shigella sonnei]HJF06706.1 nucleoid-associated protein [Phocaeicola coprocola]EFJ2957800.1 nucleoid-associated protein [Escherichia coli]EHP6384657.1 nucleoid-associated protein [Escherichia coli]EIA1313221.1 nucleoid-associated protein [Escherichia coli]